MLGGEDGQPAFRVGADRRPVVAGGLVCRVPLTSLACPSCGAPLPGSARWATTTCSFCGATVANQQRLVSAAEYHAALARDGLGAAGAVTVRDHRWQVHGRLGSGTQGEVLLVSRARRLTEYGVAHVLRDGADPAALERTWSTLSALARSTAQGAAVFSRRLPAPVDRGPFGGGPPAVILSHPYGYTHDLSGLRRLLPGGLDPRHVVWIWRRALEVLGFVHASGYVHGNVRAEHLLLDAADHGAMLVGWSSARRDDDTAADLAALSGALRSVCPAPPAPLERLLDDAPGFAAWTLLERVAVVARGLYGPPAFVPLLLPGHPPPR